MTEGTKIQRKKVKKYINDVLSGRRICGKLERLAVERHLADLENADKLKIRFDEVAAMRCISFFSILKHSKGEFSGKRFELEPWQMFIVWVLFGWKRLDGSRRFRYAYVEVARKNGKALSLDTELPTPTGWTTMGDVNIGDKLFDENGDVCTVIETTEIQYNRDCYNVMFSDGTNIIADKDHLWFTETKRTGRAGGKTLKGIPKDKWTAKYEDKIHTTEELKNTLTVNPNSGINHSKVEWNHKIPVAGALNIPEIKLPFPPYTLGVWLGDGHSRCAQITLHETDQEVIDAIIADGVPVKNKECARQGKTITISLTDGDRTQKARNNSIQARLRELNLINNKHIPDIYKRASLDQRLELLRGLMDSDGYVSKAGQCEFTTINRGFADDVYELIISVGLKCKITTETSKLYGKDCGLKHRLMFWAYDNIKLFNLTRKQNRLNPKPKTITRNGYRQIVSIEPVKSVPVRCIQVDSKSKLYLASRSMIPTHNTTFAAALSLYMMVLDGEDGAEIYTAATKRDQAKICWTEARNMVGKSPALSNKIARFQSALTMESTLSKMEPLAADSDKLDGLNPHFAVVDEYHAHKTDMLYNVLKSATGARRQPMIFTITTAGFDKTSPCFLMRRTYIDVLLGIKKQENTFVMIYSADEGDDWKDPKTWAKSNPNMGISISAEYLEEEFKSALNRGGSEEVNFKTKNLNQWVDAPTVWIQDEKVRKCSNGTTDADLVGQTCYAGLDLASHVDINALALYFPELKAIKLYYWIPEAKMEENADRVDYKTWAAEGRIFVTEGNVIDIDAQVEKITEIIRGVNCRNIAFDPAKAYHGTVQGLQKAGLNNILDEFNQSIKTMSEPTRELQRLVESAEVDLMDDPVLRWMFRNAVAVTDANDNIKLHKAKSMNKIDGLTAIINAIGGYMSGAKPEPYKDSDLKILKF
jgi:phage terminase large subunit-like protein